MSRSGWESGWDIEAGDRVPAVFYEMLGLTAGLSDPDAAPWATSHDAPASRKKWPRHWRLLFILGSASVSWVAILAALDWV